MNHYKDTTQQPNTLETLKTAQNDNHTKVTLLDMVKSILLAVLMIGLLLLISSYHQAHPKNNLQSVAGVIDNKDLSKNNSGQASRYSLAFFVPKFWKASQANQDKDTTHRPKSTGANRHIMPALAISYDGFTQPNTTAVWRISWDSLVGLLEMNPSPYCIAVRLISLIKKPQEGIFHA